MSISLELRADSHSVVITAEESLVPSLRYKNDHPENALIQ
jgi:hypothetical protein